MVSQVIATCLFCQSALAYAVPAGRMGSLILKNSSNSVLRSQSYAYRADWRVSSHTVDSVATTYDYDEEGQLLTETKGSVTSSYTYDGNYNRLTKAVTGQPTETFSYDDADRLLTVASSAGTKGFTYDNDGRCTSETWNSTVVKEYVWNVDGRMTSATGSWGTRSYAYNGFGARVSETGGANRAWFRRGPSVTAPVLKDGINRYTPGTSLRALAGGTSTFQHGGLKSLDAQTDSSQAVSGTKTYDAFGATASSTGSWQGQSGFGGNFGYQEDDTGLSLLGHRYYDPSIGRFLSRDPIKEGFNWYAYCRNDPVNRADPTGLGSIWKMIFKGAGKRGKDVEYIVTETVGDIGRIKNEIRPEGSIEVHKGPPGAPARHAHITDGTEPYPSDDISDVHFTTENLADNAKGKEWENWRDNAQEVAGDILSIIPGLELLAMPKMISDILISLVDEPTKICNKGWHGWEYGGRAGISENELMKDIWNE
ncbi:MAG: RHS repeat-associated core domain-containing protein [Chthonomonadaceae bacterium]|nr:RHS repeat-associated core domain-containing protein [Chthonomonadaceae bacterium]